MIWGEQGSPEAPSLLPQLYFGSRIIPVSILGPHHAHPGAQPAFHAVRGRDGRGREGRRVNGLHSRATGVEERGLSPAAGARQLRVPWPWAGLGRAHLLALATRWAARPRDRAAAVSGGESHHAASGPMTTLGSPTSLGVTGWAWVSVAHQVQRQPA